MRCCLSNSFADRGDPVGATPSWPFAATTTGTPVTATPEMLPIKQVLLTFAPLTFAPIQMTLSAVVTPFPALRPKAVLALPVVLLESAAIPLAVLLLPVSLKKSAA